MARTLRRPMFRIGGMAHEQRTGYMGGGMSGVMSGIMPTQPDAGLTPRMGYAVKGKVESFEDLQTKNRIKQEIQNKSPFLSPTQIDDEYNKYVEGLDYEAGILEDFEDSGTGPGSVFEKKQTDLDTARSEEGKKSFIADLTAKEKEKEKKLIDKGIISSDKSVFTEEDKTRIGTSGAPGGGDPNMIYQKPAIKKLDIEGVTSDKDEIGKYMKMFEDAAGGDPDESRRSKYLELAKFGANLLAQPGGDLIGAVGKAAAPSIGGLSTQMASDRDAKRQLRIAGVQAYLKDQDPGSIGKAVKDIMKANPDVTMKEALTMAMQTGSATKGSTKESRIQEYSDVLLGSEGAPEDKRKARSLAEKIENSGLGFSNFEPLPEEPIDGEYYYDKNGKIYKGTEDGVVELNIKK